MHKNFAMKFEDTMRRNVALGEL